jgi:hypothetical protein
MVTQPVSVTGAFVDLHVHAVEDREVRVVQHLLLHGSEQPQVFVVGGRGWCREAEGAERDDECRGGGEFLNMTSLRSNLARLRAFPGPGFQMSFTEARSLPARIARI